MPLTESKKNIDWSKLRLSLKNVIPAKDWKSFEEAKFEGSIGNDIYLKAPTSFEKVLLIKHLSKINEALFYSTGVKYIVSFEKMPIEATTRNYKDTFLSRDYDFDNFIVGKYNNEVKNAAKIIIEKPHLTNVLFMFGPCGVGKTHMLHAIGNHIYDNYPDKKIIYIKSDDLNRRIYSIMKDSDKLESLKDELIDYDVILIDDIQMIQNKGKIGEIAFYSYNKFIENKKTIIVVSDISPDELKIEKRVTSRLTSGLVQHIAAPDIETIKKIIALKLKKENFSITPDGIEWIATRCNGDIRKINSIIVKLIFHSLNNDVTLLSKADLEKIFKTDSANFTKQYGFEVSPIHVINTVCATYKIPVETVKSKTKVKQVSFVRNVCLYILKKKCHGMSLSQIGSYLGRANHSTVIEGIKKIEDAIKEEPSLGTFLESLCKEI